jgi:hypothetical protein
MERGRKTHNSLRGRGAHRRFRIRYLYQKGVSALRFGTEGTVSSGGQERTGESRSEPAGLREQEPVSERLLARLELQQS